MIIFNRCFAPSWLMSILTVGGVLVFIMLGMWQLERAAFKDALKLKFETRLASDFRPFDAEENLSDIEYRKLILRGLYDNSRSIILDNQLLRGRAGYHVLSPFMLAGSDNIVLVDRGWVTLGASRENLPTVENPLETGQVRGIANVPDTSGLRFGEVSLQDSWPQLIPFIDIQAMQPTFDNRLLPMVLWLSPEQAGHYQRYWNPAWQNPEKSRAYAVQWFSFAFIACVLYIVLNLRKPE